MTGKRPLRIAQLVGNLETGGTQTLLIEMMRRLDRTRFDPILIHFKDPNHFADEIRERGWRCLKARASRNYRVGEIRALADVLRREQPDLVHTHSDFANFAGRAAAIHAAVPHVIAHYHNTYEHRLDEAFHAMEGHLAPHTDAFVACSEGVQEFLAQHIDLKDRPVHLLQNGVNLAPFREAAARRAEARRHFAIPDNVFHIVHTARLEPHKQPQQLLHALATLTPEESGAVGPWRLTYIGGGSLREELEKLIDELDARGGTPVKPNVVFAGWTKEIPAWLASADLFCLVSRNEGLPLSLVEAMAAGTPTISPDIVGPREVIAGAANGLLVDSSDPAAIRAAILRLRRDPVLYRQIAADGAARAERFSIERFVDNAEALYDRVLAEPGINAPHPMGAFRRFLFLHKLQRLARRGRDNRRARETP